MAGSESHGSKAILAAFLANLGIAIAKFVGFLFTGSGSMLAESVHSVADTGNQSLLFLGGRRAQRPATPEHPFGYARERYFWSFIVAVVLFTLGALFAWIEGIEKLRHPHEVEQPAWAITVLVIAIALESVSMRTAVREARPHKRDASWWSFVRRSKLPELPVVLLEDLGALLGLLVALAAVSLTVITGESVFDAAGTLIIGTLLAAIAVILASEMKSLLIGESAAPAVLSGIGRCIEAQSAVQHLIHMRTQHLGPEELLVAAKVQFDAQLGTEELAHAVDQTEAAVRAAVGEATIIYLEPDMHTATATNGDPPSRSSAFTP